MSISVKLDAFEGPIDLLLQLIEKNKIDIYDIPIAQITDQYMEVINSMSEDKLDEMDASIEDEEDDELDLDDVPYTLEDAGFSIADPDAMDDSIFE